MTTNNEAMSSSGPPIVEHGDQPAMSNGSRVMSPVEQIVDANAGDQMKARGTEPTGSAGGDGDEMDPVDQDRPPTFTEPPSLGGPSDDDVGDGYLRLTVRYEQGELSVIGARVVDGPLTEAEPVGDLLYQAVIDGRRVATHGLPEMLLARGFPDEENEIFHHGTGTLETSEFMVRVKREDITHVELAQLEIEVVRPARPSVAPAPGETLQAEASRTGQPEPQIVARTKGIDMASLPKDDADLLRRRLR